MIKPTALYNFARSCTNSQMVGNIVRALCGQKVALNPMEKVLFTMIDDDNETMTKLVAERREKERIRKTEYRAKLMSRGVPNCPTGQERDKTDVPSPTILPTDHPTDHPTHQPTNPSNLPTTNNNSAREGAEVVDGGGDGDGVDGGLLSVGMAAPFDFEAARKDAQVFARQVKEHPDNPDPFFDETNSPLSLCIAVGGGSEKGINYWRRICNSRAESDIRQEVYAFYRECQSGEVPDNKGAALNARLTDLPKKEAK